MYHDGSGKLHRRASAASPLIRLTIVGLHTYKSSAVRRLKALT